MKCFAILISITLSFSVFAQYPAEGYSLNNPTFLDSTIANYNVFFTGEMHWAKENVNRQKKMIEYLSSKNSLDKIITERSYAFGHWINHFITTGDTLFLKKLLKDDYYSYLKGVQYVDNYGFYIWLRKYIIANDLSIKIVGIDLEDFWNEKEVLWSFLNFTELNPILKSKLKQNIKEATSLMNQDKVSISRLNKWLNNLEKTLETVSVDDFHFLNYVHNLNQSVRYARGNPKNYRDRQIADNFKRYINENEKVYGWYGNGHIGLKHGKRTKALKEFGSILNQESEYKGKILSIGLVSFNCINLGQFRGKHFYIPYLTKEEFIRLEPQFKKLPTNTFVDLRQTNEIIKEYVQILLIVHN